MKKYLFFFIFALSLKADPRIFVGTNEVGTAAFSNVSGERLTLKKIGRRVTEMEENPVNYTVGHILETPSFWKFLIKSEHNDPFSYPDDGKLLWSEGQQIPVTAFEYRQYSIPGIPDSSALGLGGYLYQIRYEFVPPQPVATNFFDRVIRGPGKTNFFIGITRKLETGERYLGWLELIRPQADEFAPFSLGRSALDFLPDRAIKAGQQPEFPKVQTEVTETEVRLSVPTAYRRYLDTRLVLEKAESLDEPVNWEPLTFGGTNSMTLPADAEMRFYRLRLAQ